MGANEINKTLALSIQDFVLNVNDKLIDLTSFIETDTDVTEDDACFQELSEVAYHIYEAHAILENFIKEHYK